MNEIFNMAAEGRNLWLEIKNTYHIDASWYIILCPEPETELNHILLENLPKFLQKKYIHHAIILFTPESFNKALPEYENLNIEYLSMSSENIKKIQKYYSLMQFEKNILVASLTPPFGNRSILKKDEITLKTYIEEALFV